MFKSERILLRALIEKDAIFINEMRNDFIGYQAAGGSPFPSNIASQEEWISKMYPAGNLSNIYLAIEEIESGLFVGYCLASNINFINSNAHVGFFLHANSRGKGYFKEVSVLFYSYLFNELNLKKVYSYVLGYNEIALKTDKKLGFQVDGVMKEHVFQKGKYHDAVIISLTSIDFFKINSI